jgi:molybdopterin biosynthesis enzyme MoaB
VANEKFYKSGGGKPPLLSFVEVEPMPIRTAILLISPPDSTEDEETVQTLTQMLRQSLPAYFLIHQQYGTSQRYWIEETLRRWCDEEELDLILTVGGTFPAPGPSGEEVVPEATLSVLERSVPSLPETMRAYALEEDATAILDRGVAGIRGRTLLINLPAGPQLALLFVRAILDLLPMILARLQPQTATDVIPTQDEPSQTAPNRNHKLDSQEFSEFLRKRRDTGE